jgi:hypothetical protein
MHIGMFKNCLNFECMTNVRFALDVNAQRQLLKINFCQLSKRRRLHMLLLIFLGEKCELYAMDLGCKLLQ